MPSEEKFIEMKWAWRPRREGRQQRKIQGKRKKKRKINKERNPDSENIG